MSRLLLENAGVVKPSVSSYLWEVANYSSIQYKLGDYIASPVFSTTCKDNWRLHLFPKGQEEKNKKNISLFLKYLGQTNNVNVNITLSLIDEKNCKVIERDFQKLYEKGSSAFGFADYEKQNFVTDKANHILLNDTIYILCEIIYDSELASPVKKRRIDEENLPVDCRLQEFDEFEKLLEDKNSTDVIIKIGQYEIKVHKAIIMARSPVFQAMFEHEMKEKEQSTVEITDIKYEVMKEVCRFMYVAKVNEIENIAGDLLIAADKYSIKGLKALCEKQLFKNLTVSNAVEYLKLADMCNADDLKYKVIKFVVSNQKEIVHSPELQSLPMEVVCEVLRAIVGENSST